VFGVAVHGRLWLTKIMPLSNVIVLANWLPLGAALLAGVLSGDQRTPQRRRASLAFALLAVGWSSVTWFSTSPQINSGNRFKGGVCLQSTSATCAACSAVTLLDCYGIPSSEHEMAQLCLNSIHGATMLGIYRGLKLKTRGTDYDVEPVQCHYEDLQHLDAGPMLIPVRLANLSLSAGSRPVVWNLLTRINHCVVLFGFTPKGKAVIGDPSNGSFGRVEWTQTQLRQRWLGEGFRLVQRK
jgi:hypothetical protein